MLRSFAHQLASRTTASYTHGAHQMRTMASGKRVAVVLSGCGVYDGAEIFESVFTLNQLSKLGVKTQCFAPDKPQMHVVNHLAGSPNEGETRNVLQESARIARGNITDLKELKSTDYDAVIFPGGFGAAKNLSDFGVKAPDYTVYPEVEAVIKDFHSAGKVQGFMCIAPTLPAKVLGNGVELTVGSDKESEEWPYAGASGAIEAKGAKHVAKPLNEALVDMKNKIVTSAAFMCALNIDDVSKIEESVVATVNKVVEMS